jgi:hypothetical protein
MNVFSFCIYGQKAYYYEGLLANVKLIKEQYPTWPVYIYVGKDARLDLLDDVNKAYNNIRWRETHEEGSVNMLYRFLAIDEPDVAVMHVRDADSRIHARDQWAISAFTALPHQAYTIRDHPQHNVRMMGGLWGCRRLTFRMADLVDMFRRDLHLITNEYGYDQQFLANHVYPRVAWSFVAFGDYHRSSMQETCIGFDKNLPIHPFCGQPE